MNRRRVKPSRRGARGSHLLVSYLERVSWRLFEEYSEHLRHFIRRKRGIYALYHHDRLYYVGLASDLMWRVKNHLRDGHRRKWDRFSVYLTANDQHTRQLESLVLRIMVPQGNKVRGRLQGATNLLRGLDDRISEAEKDERARLLGGYLVRRRRRAKTSRRKGSLTLPNLFDRGTPLRGRHRGRSYCATLRTDGRIRYKRKLYESPSGAAEAAIGREANGWYFWRFRTDKNQWARLKEIRK